MGNLLVTTRAHSTEAARACVPWAQPRSVVVMVRESRMRKPSTARAANSRRVKSKYEAWGDELPDPEALLGGNAEYEASMERLLLISGQFQKLLDAQQARKWLELEDAFLRHLSLVQNAFYVAGCEGARAEARTESRALLVELLTSFIETQTARLRSKGQRCDGRCIEMATALSRLLR